MIKHEWILIDKEKEMPTDPRFLLSDEYGNVYVGSMAFDYYDAKYWFPMPKFPICEGIITNDECMKLALKDEQNYKIKG